MDELIDQFEKRCEVGDFVDIGDFLHRVKATDRTTLFIELLGVEIFYRAKADKARSKSQYIEAFPDFEAQIREVFESEQTNRSDREAPTELDSKSIRQESRQIDRYKLLQEIGQGGMGTVWMAEQIEPIRRKVALKLIRTDRASDEVITRFEAERQALSMMDHPNIARVFDAGTTDADEPFFVMELVKGVPLTEYCDQNRLSIRERLQLFVPVCEAVQHAHQKGIIHRDLKPSNVLVGIYDGKPVPKVIDFGLAKALEHTTKLTDKTMFTEFGKVIGTLQYMAPEQAEINSLDVDTRADVYSLGVMLYELLTGSTPLERELVGKKKLLQILQMIRDSDPPRPSARLESSDSTSNIYDLRKVTPAKLNSILQGELDWVVMKALEKDRTRRYDSAGNVADDIQRFLDGDAVGARPPSTRYRVSKFIKKNRTLVAAAATIAVLLVSAVAVSSWFAVEASIARNDAELRTKEVTKEKEHATLSAKRSSDVLQIVTDSFKSINPDEGADAEMTAKEVLFNAQQSLETSELDDEGKAMLLRSLTTSFMGVGEYNSAISTATEEVAIAKAKLGDDYPDTLVCMNNLARAYQSAGRLKDALPLFEQTLAATRAKLGDDHHETLAIMGNLAVAYRSAGRLEEAMPLFEKTLAGRKAQLGDDHPQTIVAMGSLAGAYLSAGRLEEALPLFEKTLAAMKAKLGDDHPDTLTGMNDLALAYKSAGRTDEALPLFEQTLAAMKAKLGDNHPNTLTIMNNLASAYRSAGRPEEEIPLFEQTLAELKTKLGDDHPKTLTTMNNLAAAYQSAGRLKEALPLFEKTLAARKAKLGDNHPNTLSTMNDLAYAYRSAGRHEEALTLYEQTLAARKAKLGDDHPSTLHSMNNLALGYSSAGQPDKALPLFEQTLAATKAKQGDNHPDTLHSMNSLAGVWLEYAWLESGHSEKAEGVLRESVEIRNKNAPDAWTTFYTQFLLGKALLFQKKFDEALPLLTDGYEGMKQRAKSIPKSSRNKRLVEAVNRLVQLAEAQEKPEDIKKWQAELDALKQEQDGAEKSDK